MLSRTPPPGSMQTPRPPASLGHRIQESPSWHFPAPAPSKRTRTRTRTRSKARLLGRKLPPRRSQVSTSSRGNSSALYRIPSCRSITSQMQPAGRRPAWHDAGGISKARPPCAPRKRLVRSWGSCRLRLSWVPQVPWSPLPLAKRARAGDWRGGKKNPQQQGTNGGSLPAGVVGCKLFSSIATRFPLSRAPAPPPPGPPTGRTFSQGGRSGLSSLGGYFRPLDCDVHGCRAVVRLCRQRVKHGTKKSWCLARRGCRVESSRQPSRVSGVVVARNVRQVRLR